MNAFRLDQVSKGLAELRTTIVQQIAAVREKAPVLHGYVAGLLLHPWLVGIWRYPRQANPSRLQLNEEQHVIGCVLEKLTITL